MILLLLAITQLHQFLGMVMFLSPFMPSLSSAIVTLCELLWKIMEFQWNSSYEAIKPLISTDTTQKYFNVCKLVSVQVDASKHGLDTTIPQDGMSIVFTSKSTHPSQAEVCKHRQAASGSTYMDASTWSNQIRIPWNRLPSNALPAQL